MARRNIRARKVRARMRPERIGSGSLTVNDVMSSPVITAGELTSVMDVAQLMTKNGIGAIVITNKSNEPVGMITEGDIVRRLVSRKRNLWFSKAKHIMSNPVLTVGRAMSLEAAAKYMAANRVRKLCVVDASNKLNGVITSTDLMKNESYLIDVLKEIINTGYEERKADVGMITELDRV